MLLITNGLFENQIISNPLACKYTIYFQKWIFFLSTISANLLTDNESEMQANFEQNNIKIPGGVSVGFDSLLRYIGHFQLRVPLSKSHTIPN